MVFLLFLRFGLKLALVIAGDGSEVTFGVILCSFFYFFDMCLVPLSNETRDSEELPHKTPGKHKKNKQPEFGIGFSKE